MTEFKPLPKGLVTNYAQAILQEDLSGASDLTTEQLITSGKTGSAKIIANTSGIVCGTDLAKKVFQLLDKNVKITTLKKDGQKIKKGEVIMRIKGKVSIILTGERSALNFLHHLSGISTLTKQFVDASSNKVAILDTRKTTPGLRVLEKYAVVVGGGMNHRFGLYDMILIKDNHWPHVEDITKSVILLRLNVDVLIEIEAQNISQVKKAVAANPDIILLDNMDLKLLKQAINIIRKEPNKIKIEVSGNMTIEKVKSISKLNIDFISVGALTHSAPILPFSLQFIS